MAGIRQSIETNKKLLILIAVILIIILTFLLKFYADQKRENRALRIKILSMSENKRTPKPWSALTTKSTSASTQTAKASRPSIATTAGVPQSLTAEDTQTLATTLETQMKRVKNADVATLDKNIAIADEIISREPDSYGAYKAKLISLLTKEGKFNQTPDESEIEGLLESMAQFNISSDKLARREAALISNTNSEIQNVESKLDMLARQRETMESQLSGLDGNSPELNNLNDQIMDIEDQEAELAENIESLENNLASNTAQISNEDVIEIPFMRMLAKGDYEGIQDSAQGFIGQFPNSSNGYFYMVRALELQGNKEEANRVIQNAKLPSDVQQSLLQRLESQSTSNPQNYWQQLNF